MYGDGYEMGKPPRLFPSWLCPSHTLPRLHPGARSKLFAASRDALCAAPRARCLERSTTLPWTPTPRAGDTYGSMDYSSADGYGSYGEAGGVQ